MAGKAAKKPVTKAKGKAKAPAKTKVPAKAKAPARPQAKAQATAQAKVPAKAKTAATKPLSPAFQAVLDALGNNPGISRPKMFGSNGVAVGGKYFAIDWKGNLVVKLPRDDVDTLVGQGVGTHFDPGMGRPMKEWLQVPPGATDWVQLAERALAFVASRL
jgi:hypothetical protein